jgi:hypothetical protein
MFYRLNNVSHEEVALWLHLLIKLNNKGKKPVFAGL